ncbi:MAG: 5'-3' exonuclease H3TH domain-containing protein, partial [Pseudomonadota bacterium]|nr:5'-3' exonuclease H3TH domain-containing protein [Pseudomonadota bacterium]
MKAGDHLFLVDGSSYIFRAYHALPPLTRKSDGLPVGAVSGFCNMLWKLLTDARDTDVGVVPTHFAVIFDHSARTFRKELYPDYKANREEPPEDLRPQFGIIRDATRAFGLPCIEMEGFEADDIIATYARLAREAGGDVTIVSSDKDLMQLVGDQVILYDQMKDRRIGVPEVVEKWGVPPDKMIALQTLTGDSTDNIPGVPGIGPKTAAQLLDEYGDIDTLFASLDTIKQPKRRENLQAFAGKADLTRQLVTLKDDVPLDESLDDLVLDDTDGARLVAFLKAMEFNTLTRRVAEATGVEAAEIDAAEIETPEGAQMRGPDLDSAADSGSAGAVSPGGDAPGVMTPASLAEARRSEAATAAIDRSAYECVRDETRLKEWVAMIVDAGLVAVDTETTSL